jgi:YD repeat-containing protein
LLTSTTDADGASWKYRYDDSGNLTAEIDPLGNTTAYANDERGLPSVITDAHGGRKQLQWDRRGLLVQYTDCSGKTTRYVYDKRGYPQQETDALGQTTTLAHDARGRLLELHLPDGAVHRYQYDGAGQVVAATDPLGRTTSYNYSPRGQLTGRVKTVAGRSSSIQFGYDAAHRLTVLVNESRKNLKVRVSWLKFVVCKNIIFRLLSSISTNSQIIVGYPTFMSSWPCLFFYYEKSNININFYRIVCLAGNCGVW